jgi:hypothetical protein
MCAETLQLVRDLEHWDNPSEQPLEQLSDQLSRQVGGSNKDSPNDGYALVSKACGLLDLSLCMEPEALNIPMEDLDLGYGRGQHADTSHYHQWSDAAHASSTMKLPAYFDLLPPPGSPDTCAKNALLWGESNDGRKVIPSDVWQQKSIISAGNNFPYGISNFPQASCGGLEVTSYNQTYQRPNHEPQDVGTISGSGNRTPQRHRNVLRRIKKVKTDGNLRGKSRERAPGESYMEFD